jgi:protein-tyrosine phosphatase
MPNASTRSILFVCLGNICRSPLAEGVLRHLARARGIEGELVIDSAGTGAWHVGEPPDRRAAEVARRHGIELTSRARQVEAGDAHRFDLVVAMDRSNLKALEELFGRDRAEGAEVRLFRDFDPQASGPADVPDPYFGGDEGFEAVHAMVVRGCSALLDTLESGPEEGSPPPNT